MKIHSFLSPKCEVRNSKLGGKGVFCKKDILKDEIIAIWGGKIYSESEISQLSKNFPHLETHPVTVWEGYYLGPLDPYQSDDVEAMNHSCNPNAGIKGQLLVIARRKINKEEEICFDYDTTEIGAVPFNCYCGSRECRKIIDGSSWKNPEFIKKNADYLSYYVQEIVKKM